MTSRASPREALDTALSYDGQMTVFGDGPYDTLLDAPADGTGQPAP